MEDGTRMIFWIDLIVLLVVTLLIAKGKWDAVLALFLALVFLNYFDSWFNRHRS